MQPSWGLKGKITPQKQKNKLKSVNAKEADYVDVDVN
jgi:hypothetical protein